MTVTECITLLSLALTPMSILASAGVVALWWQSGKRALIRSDRRDLDWFIIGVMIGFAGNLVDNLYWGLAWTLHYLHNDSWHFWFDNGVYSNVVFRQTATALAAVCHIKAGIEAKSRLLQCLYVASAAGGLAFVWLLLVARP